MVIESGYLQEGRGWKSRNASDWALPGFAKAGPAGWRAHRAGRHHTGERKSEVTEAASRLLFLDRNDNLIIGTALYFKKKYPDSEVTLVSKDVNVRIKADSVYQCWNFETDTIKYDEFIPAGRRWRHLRCCHPQKQQVSILGVIIRMNL